MRTGDYSPRLEHLPHSGLDGETSGWQIAGARPSSIRGHLARINICALCDCPAAPAKTGSSTVSWGFVLRRRGWGSFVSTVYYLLVGPLTSSPSRVVTRRILLRAPLTQLLKCHIRQSCSSLTDPSLLAVAVLPSMSWPCFHLWAGSSEKA